MKKFIIFFLIFLTVASVFLFSGCSSNFGSAGMKQSLQIVDINDIIVHDPSVFYDEVTGKYYAFGSHFAVASSYDLISWEQESYENDATKLFGTRDFRSVIPQSDEFTGREGGINSTWAPDVIKYGDTYYMYYALTSAFGSGKSVIGRVSSKNILGPYSNEEVLIYSHDDWWNEPNAIDPELFYDKNGKLWMVYGSYFAGIYIKEFYNYGENFGLPIEEGFGKKIWWGGYSSGVEGPFVFYSAETDYYYLMVSEGNLMYNYNMRVARSRNPDGPYEDVMGNDTVLTPEGKGNKLASNFKYVAEYDGHAALGHNSVIKKDGEYFCVYHSRSGVGINVNQFYTMRVSKLIFNEEGWPLLAPNEYKGEVERDIERSEVVGQWDIVLHYQETIDDFASSQQYVFSETGAIIKDRKLVGRYLLDGNFVTIVIDNVKFKGKLLENFVGYQNEINISVTAVSSDGVPLMGNKVSV